MQYEHKIHGIKKLVLLCSNVALVSSFIYADEGGTGFWVPGTNGSLVAMQSEPGWYLPVVYYHSSVDASENEPLPIGGELKLGLKSFSDILTMTPTYVFSDTVSGGQASISLSMVLGRVDSAIDGTQTEPNGNVLSGRINDTLTSVGDLYPSASLRWNDGVHNTMISMMIGIPVGTYDARRLANIGSNHWAVDVTGGYTYFNPETGNELSASIGFTYNFENQDTDYQNGIDGHLDWGASKFLSERLHVGLVGYFYYQITGDSGIGAELGNFKTRVNAIGPQVGYNFDMGDKRAYVNFKGFWEFNANNRTEGWNSWLTLSFPLGSENKQ